MNRRDFLKGAGAAIVPAAIPATIWESQSQPDLPSRQVQTPGSPPIAAVVFDERYADCKIFAAALVARGAIAFPAKGDSAQLWYGSLGAHLARSGGRVAGLTSDSDFVVARACGRELGLQVIYEGAHDGRASNGNLSHAVRSTAGSREIVAALAFPGAAWAESLAAALCRIPLTDRSRNPSASRIVTPRSRNHPGYLASWLLGS
ncbi:MAG TPA: twin-arginine translocation signal domain-containing protein [Candidatus Acidoferrales bacterium]|nr:twin-arginine translocation signal domain-containing protein [Candidatus Acidoferrales bacterium]